MKRYRPCSFRIESEIGENCTIQSKPSIYSISPYVCDECTMVYPACEYLEAKVLLGEKNTGGVTASVIGARCLKKGIKFNSLTFDECSTCPEFVMKLPRAKNDELTGLYLRDYFNTNIRQFFLSSGENAPFSVIFFDIDHFKLINDSYGHQAGDIILKEVASVIKNETGISGAACRYGGEEIVVLMPSAPSQKAFSLAENIRKRIEAMCFTTISRELRVTISSGVSEYPKFGAKSESELVEQADKALYRAKEEGRNRTYLFDPVLDSDESLQVIEIDYPGIPTFSIGSVVEIKQWIPYPSNPKKIMAVNIKDMRTGTENILGQEKLEEILRFAGEPALFSFSGKVENISLSEKRSVFLVKIRKNAYSSILEESVSFLYSKISSIQDSIKAFKKAKN